MAETERVANFVGTTVRGTFWTYAAFYGGKLMVFLSTIILARLLTKEDFGIVGYALVAVGFLEVVSDFGIGTALIYYKDNQDITYTAFWINLLIGFGLYVVTWFAAPLVGVFFNDPRAVLLTRVLALSLPISAFGDIQNFLMRKELLFERKFIPDFFRMAAKGILSIFFALLGFGAWSLALGQVGGAIVSVISYWTVLAWRPAFRFSGEMARALLSYGASIFSVNILTITLLNADYLFIGRFLGAEALGAYTLAFRIPELMVIQFCSIVGSVVFPIYSKVKDTPNALSRGFLETMRYVALFTVPIGVGLALVAEPFVLTAFTAKWRESIPALQALALYSVCMALPYHISSVYKALGHINILRNLSLLRVFFLVFGFLWAVLIPKSITAVSWVHVVVAFAAGLINLIVATRSLNIPFRIVLEVLRPVAVSVALMAAAVAGILALLRPTPALVQLVTSVLVGLLSYCGTLWWVQREVVLQAGEILRVAVMRRRLKVLP